MCSTYVGFMFGALTHYKQIVFPIAEDFVDSPGDPNTSKYPIWTTLSSAYRCACWWYFKQVNSFYWILDPKHTYYSALWCSIFASYFVSIFKYDICYILVMLNTLDRKLFMANIIQAWNPVVNGVDKQFIFTKIKNRSILPYHLYG